jgi:hypothetical protein
VAEDSSGQRGYGWLGSSRISTVAAQGWILVGQDDLRAGFGRGQPRAEAGRAAAYCPGGVAGSTAPSPAAWRRTRS